MISKDYIENTVNLAEAFLNEHNKRGRAIVLYGGGWAAHWYVRWLVNHGIVPAYIIDNSPEKNTYFEEVVQGEKIKIPILSKEEIKDIRGFIEFEYIVGAPKFKHEIIQEIKKTFGKVKIYSFESEIYYTFIKDILAYRKYLSSHIAELQMLYDMLQDEKSKVTLDSIIKGRISANQDYFIDVMVENQYFPHDIVKLNENEVIVEIGSNDGKTLLDIINKTEEKYKKIYCFEPDKECIKLLKDIIFNLNKPIELIPKGCGAETAKVFFKTDSALGGSRVVKDDKEYDYSIEVTTLDEEIPEDVTYIKMDVEGLELDCLKGAEKLIRRCSPKLAVCVYHNPEDIIEIPKYLYTINPKYKFYLRHHSWGATETVLYAI